MDRCVIAPGTKSRPDARYGRIVGANRGIAGDIGPGIRAAVNGLMGAGRMLSVLLAVSLVCVVFVAVRDAAVASDHPDSLKGYNATPTILRPVYPSTHACSPITSLYGSWFDLDGTRRDERHTGIDLGELGDIVLAPAAGVVTAIWETDHGWGTDWNVLITHSAADLNLPESYREFLLSWGK